MQKSTFTAKQQQRLFIPHLHKTRPVTGLTEASLGAAAARPRSEQSVEAFGKHGGPARAADPAAAASTNGADADVSGLGPEAKGLQVSTLLLLLRPVPRHPKSWRGAIGIEKGVQKFENACQGAEGTERK